MNIQMKVATIIKISIMKKIYFLTMMNNLIEIISKKNPIKKIINQIIKKIIKSIIKILIIIF